MIGSFIILSAGALSGVGCASTRKLRDINYTVLGFYSVVMGTANCLILSIVSSGISGRSMMDFPLWIYSVIILNTLMGYLSLNSSIIAYQEAKSWVMALISQLNIIYPQS